MATNKIKNVRRERGPKNLSSVTIASTDIYKIQPIFCRETKPNDIFNVKHLQVNICDALSVPSFVDVKTRNTWAYVPFSKLWQPFESVLGGTSITLDGYSYKLKQMPVLDPLFVFGIMIKNGYLEVVDMSDISENKAYDFRMIEIGADNYQYYRFSPVGRRIWNVMQGLGYKLSMFNTYTSFNDPEPDNTAITGVEYTHTTVDSLNISFVAPSYYGASSIERYSIGSWSEVSSYSPYNVSQIEFTDPQEFKFRYKYDDDTYSNTITLTFSRSNPDNYTITVDESGTHVYEPYKLEITPFGVAPSALPLFAYAKVYAENFVPGKYADICNKVVSGIYNLTEYLNIQKLTLNHINTESFQVVFTGVSADAVQLMEDIFSLLSSVYYGDDYFTSSPVQAMTSPDGLNDVPLFGDLTTDFGLGDKETMIDKNANDNFTPVHKGATNVIGLPSLSDTPYMVSDYIHSMLHLVTKNIQLKALAGSKLAQRLYALYGIKSDVHNREGVLLGQNVSQIDVRSITSLADTGDNGAELGQKGGQMNNANDGKYHWEFQEFGVLICINQIIPVYFYGQGLHREMMHVKPNDFYNDQFALAGEQNIGRFELFGDDQLGYYDKANLNLGGSFGKTSAYAEYALRKDMLVGDFSLLSRMNLLDAYHFNRFLVDQQSDMLDNKKVSELGLLPRNNEDFLKVFNNEVDGIHSLSINHQFDRIFTDSDANDDHIAQYNEFKISAVRDGRNINDFTIGEDDGHEVELAGLGKVLYG